MIKKKRSKAFILAAILFLALQAFSASAASPFNHSPYLEPLPESDATAVVNSLMSFTLSGVDSDLLDTLTYGVDVLPDGAIFTPATGDFSWTATSTQLGMHPVTFSVTDGVDTAYLSVDLNIIPEPANQAPMFFPLNDRMIEADKTLTFMLHASDPDGDELGFSSDNLPVGSSLATSTGDFSWTPIPADIGTTSVDFDVTDSMATDTQTVMINVIATSSGNQVPVIFPMSDQYIQENKKLIFYLDGNDQDGNTLEFSLSPLPAGSNFDSATGYFEWTPDFTQAGDYDMSAGVSDGSLMATTSFMVIVENVNHPPVLSLYHPNELVSGELLTIVANGTDPDGEGLSYEIDDIRFSEDSPGVFTWQTATTTVGDLLFTVTATDGDMETSASAMVSIATGTPPSNEAPEFNVPDEVNVTADDELNILIDVSDPNGDDFDVTAENLPTGASFSTSTMHLVWPTLLSDVGEYEVDFLATDGMATSTHTLTINVVAPGGNGELPSRIENRLEQVEKRLQEAENRINQRLERYY